MQEFNQHKAKESLSGHAMSPLQSPKRGKQKNKSSQGERRTDRGVSTHNKPNNKPALQHEVKAQNPSAHKN